MSNLGNITWFITVPRSSPFCSYGSMSTNPASRKPRQLRGTPSYRIRNYVAVGVIAAGTALFFGVYALINDPAKNARIQRFFQMTDEEKDQRALMAFIQPKRGEVIAKMMEELEEFKRTK